MKTDLCDFITNRIRYDLPDENGLTRRERNENFGHEHLSEFVDVDEHIYYLVNWFDDMSNSVRKISDGVCGSIVWYFGEWSKITGNNLRPFEYELLVAMDRAFCFEMNLELKNYRIRQEEKAKREK